MVITLEYKPQGNHNENIYAMYIKGNNKGIKLCHYKKKKKLNVMEDSKGGTDGQKIIRYTDNRKQNGNSKFFPSQ